MTKSDVIEFLEAHPNQWFSSKEVCDAVTNGRSGTNLAKLYNNIVERRMHNIERRPGKAGANNGFNKGFEWRIVNETSVR